MNRMPSCILGFKRLLELLLCSSFGSFLPFRVFGCIYYVYVPKSDCPKLDPKALKCLFFGYALNQKDYKCYHPSICRFIVSMYVTFYEIVSFFSSSQPHLQGELRHEGEDESAFPLPVSLYFFDVDGQSNQGEIEQVAAHKENEPKATT